MIATAQFYKPLDMSLLSPPMNVVHIQDAAGLCILKDFFNRKKVFGFDLETNVVRDLNERYIRCIQFGDKEEQYVIDLLAFAQCADTLKQAQVDPEIRHLVFGFIIDIIKPVLESKDWLKVGHSLQFEYEMMKLRFGLRPWNFWDTLLAEKVIMCGAVSMNAEGYFAMDDVMRKYGKVNIDKRLQTSFDNLGVPLSQEQIIYAALDTRLPLTIKTHQTKHLEAFNLMQTAQVEFDAIPAFGDMRVNGFYCNREKWLKKYKSNVEKLNETVAQLDEFFIPVVGCAEIPAYDLVALEAKWRNETNKELRADSRKAFMRARGEISDAKEAMEKYQGRAAINYGSHEQLKLVLAKMGFKLKDTNDKTLEKLATRGKLGEPGYVKGNPIIDLIRTFRELQKAISNYGEEFLSRYISIITGRIHSNMNQIGAGTGRTSSDNPNLQNIPNDEDYRHCFEARQGFKIITVDVQGCELRIVTSMSKEPVWLEAFAKDWDIHALGGAAVFPEKWKHFAEPGCLFYLEKKKCNCKAHNGKERTNIKNLNFGVIYGLSEFGYARDTGKNKIEARGDILRFKQWIPTLWAYLERLSEDATFKLESRTTLGRRRLFKRPTSDRAIKVFTDKFKRKPNDPEIRQQLAKMWASISREGRNAPIQGGNVDLMKKAIGCGFDSNGQPFLWHRLEPETGGLLENLVHDELVIEAPDETTDKARELTQDAITRAGHEIYKDVDMESDYSVNIFWSK